MYSALKQSVPQKPNNWLPVRTFKKPKANKLATGPQSVKKGSAPWSQLISTIKMYPIVNSAVLSVLKIDIHICNLPVKHVY
jgi:hypothetical protein